MVPTDEAQQPAEKELQLSFDRQGWSQDSKHVFFIGWVFKLLEGRNCPASPHILPQCTNVNNTASDISNIAQIDGLDNVDNFNSSDDESEGNESNVSECDTNDEIEADITPISLTPVSKPNKRQQKVLQASSLPIIAVLNSRSLYNKAENFKTFLTELGIEAAIVSKSWEWEDNPLDNLLKMNQYKIQSYKRPKI